MIDIHSHILPKIDDGSKSLMMTYNMLRKCSEEGIKEIVATPHYCIGYGTTEFRKVKAMVRMLNKLMYKRKLDIKIYHGQEIYLTENTIDSYNDKKIGTINDSRYMLIELNMYNFSSAILNIIYELRIRGIVPIIAHPERYMYIVNKPIIINEFIKEGCLFQLNSGSVDGKFGRCVRRTAKILINSNIYNFIGSDAHDDKARSTGIKHALKLIDKKNNHYEEIFRISSENLLKNEIVKFEGESLKKNKWYFIGKI